MVRLLFSARQRVALVVVLVLVGIVGYVLLAEFPAPSREIVRTLSNESFQQ